MTLRIELKPGERILIGECVITNSDQRARFVVDGRRREGEPAAPVPYHLESEPFSVGPWSGITVEDFRLDREAIAACARLTMPSALADTGVADGTYVVGVPPDVPYPGLRTVFTLTTSVRTKPIMTTWVAEYALVGHNVASVGISVAALFAGLFIMRQLP